MKVHPAIYVANPEALTVDLLMCLHREPGSSWQRVERLLGIEESAAARGVARALRHTFVSLNYIAVDGVTVSGVLVELHRLTPDGVEYLLSLPQVSSGELPDLEVREGVA